jgi:hypothetical protein
LAHAAFSDLLRNIELPSDTGRIRFYLSLPDPDRLSTGQALKPEVSENEDREPETVSEDDQPGAGLDVAAEPDNDDAPPTEDETGTSSDRLSELERASLVAEQARVIIQKATHLAGWRGEAELAGSSCSGHTGIAELLERMHQDFLSRRIDFAVVGGVDSWLESDTLMWLEDTRRLHSPAMPLGFQPGEAAAFLLFERRESADARGIKPLAALCGVAIDEDPHDLLSGTLSTGRVLGNLLALCSPAAGWSESHSPWLLTDQNGEAYRAEEWGRANVAVVPRCPAFLNPIVWHPASSLGDTGAASGAVAMLVAIQAFWRNYAPSPVVAVVSSSDGPLRSVILLRSMPAGISD